MTIKGCAGLEAAASAIVPDVGVLTEFFVADADQAAALAVPGPLDSDVPTLLAKSIDPVKVATLYQIAAGLTEEVDETDDPVDTKRPEGPWLVVIRDEVTSAFAAVSDDLLPSVSQQWAATEEWTLDGGTANDLLPVVRGLRDLARQAQPPDRRLYLWMSL